MDWKVVARYGRESHIRAHTGVGWFNIIPNNDTYMVSWVNGGFQIDLDDTFVSLVDAKNCAEKWHQKISREITPHSVAFDLVRIMEEVKNIPHIDHHNNLGDRIEYAVVRAVHNLR